jgi:hypothetical protein
MKQKTHMLVTCDVVNAVNDVLFNRIPLFFFNMAAEATMTGTNSAFNFLGRLRIYA